MQNRKRFYVALSIIWLIVGFYIILGLYNVWFDTYDKIKYDPSYSPEFDRPNTMKNLVFWGVVLLCSLIELALIYMARRSTKIGR